ncbi:MAG: hypothetical protein OZ948_06700 [Deltaproteobacteria bacterium]|nr:hypothetical protein [Deltaproteobacteria bacterium]
MSVCRRVLATALLLAGASGPGVPAQAAMPDPWWALYGDATATPPIDLPVAWACPAEAPPPLPTRGARLALRAERLASARELSAADAAACRWLGAAALALVLELVPEAAAEAHRAESLAEAAGAGEAAAAARWLRAEALLAAGRVEEAEALYRTLTEAMDAGAAEGGHEAEPTRGGETERSAADGTARSEMPPPAGEAPFATADTVSPRLPAGLPELAALRLADIALAHGASRTALAAADAALPRAAARGVPVGPFVVRSAAAAAALDRTDDARTRFERALEAELDEPHRAVAHLRFAELLAGAGREGEARAQLEIVRRVDPQAPAARLAELRVLELDLDALAKESGLAAPARELRTAELVERLAALDGPEPAPIADYARRLAARLDLLADRPTAALERVLALGGEEADATLGDVLARLSTQIGDDLDCPQLVDLLAPHLDALLHRAPDPAPLAALARCQAELLGPEAALPLQRAVVRGFGPRGRAAVALGLAEGLLAVGQLDAVAAAANERLEAPGDDGAAWRRLRAEVALARGDAAGAAAMVAPLLAPAPLAPAAAPLDAAGRSDATASFDRDAQSQDPAANAAALASDPPVPLRVQVPPAPVAPAEQIAALIVLTRAARSAPRDLDLGERLIGAVERLGDELGPASGGEPLGDAALLAAHRARREGSGSRAASLYALAAAALPPGERRAQAHYWIGALAPEGDDRGEAAFAASAAEPSGGAWSALARERRAVASLHDARLTRGDG